MKLTKYQHACFTVEKDEKIIVVDPGELANDFIAPENVVAVVFTHEHGDHFDQERLVEIADKNPDVLFLGPEAVVSKLETFNKQAVNAGEAVSIEPFELIFHGGQHAIIHEGMPVIQNIGVMINELTYYPGDSFTLPGQPVDTLLLPASAPWMKISEAITFLQAIKPRLCIPTHDAILSEEGKEIADAWLSDAARELGCEYSRPNEPIEI